MKTVRTFLAFGWLLAALSPLSSSAADSTKDPRPRVRVLIVTGGHAFETNAFFQLFKDDPDITYQAVEHPNARALLKAEPAKQYDVIVMYDFNQAITDLAGVDFVALLKNGKGLVVLHHAIAAYPQWPEYWKIVGAHYYLEKTVLDGVEKPRSAYQHDRHFTVRVADPRHPVTLGIKDFEIHDETYKWFDVAPDCVPLLTTDDPESNRIIAWTKTYENARVFYMQSGHDHFAYENPSFRRVLRQAIRWVARKE